MRSIDALRFDVDGVAYVLFEVPTAGAALPASLSPAEREVAWAVIRGEANGDIARARGTSMRTVANQLGSIYAKLGISGRLDLIGAWARGAD